MGERKLNNKDVKSLVERLKDPEDHVRLSSLAELFLSKKVALSDMETIITCLDDPSQDIR